MLKRQTTKQPAAADTTLLLSPDTFETIYNTIIGLRFPVDVSQVLELRYVINRAVDDFAEPPDTRDYRDFQDALAAILDAVGIENHHHHKRFLRMLALVRDLHYTYSVNTRNAENKLRDHIARNRKARSNAIHYGLVFTFAAVLAGFGWIGMESSTWWIKLMTGGFIYLAWDYLHALPVLDREMKSLERKMSNLMRARVRSIDWGMLVQKLALVLGYKRSSEVEVFRIDDDLDLPDRSHVRH